MRPETIPPVTDSPWFWVYLFASIALIGLLFIQPKYQQRQSFIERTGQARRTAMSTVGNSEKSENVSQPESSSAAKSLAPTAKTSLQTVSLRPIILILAGAVAIGWVLFFLQRKAERKKMISESSQH